MRVLVTGGAGFIGSALARCLLERGDTVTILDNFSTGFRSNVPEGAEVLELDISTEDFVDRLPPRGFDVVCHLAAQSAGLISYEQPVYDSKTNTVGTLLLLKWARENQVRHFQYASSMNVYGNANPEQATEQAPLQPFSFYAVGKIASETYIRIFQGLGLNGTIFRLFNVYGSGQNMLNMKQGMVSIYVTFIAQKQPIVVKGSPDRFRDFVHVSDVVSAMTMSLDNPRSYGETYNVGTGQKHTVRELLRKIVVAFAEDPDRYPIRYGDPTPLDQWGVYADVTKLRRELGWGPEVPLERGLAEMAAWANTLPSERLGREP